VEQFLTPGETYVGADSYSDWMARFPNGAPSSGAYQGEGVDVKSSFRTLLGMSTPTEQRRAQIARTLVTSGPHGVVTPSAGDLVRPDWRGLLETGLLRPLTVRQLITTIPTESDAIEYAREVSRVHAAATVAEAAASTGATGLKPEGGLEFALVSDTVKTIAAWVAATKRIIADATGLAAYINQYLSDDIALELEDQITSGNGVGEDFVGILNTPGIQTQGVPAGTETILDIFRFAKRKIRVNARTNATAALVNPEDLEIIDTLKAVTSGNYLGNDPFAWSPNPTLWGIPLIESEAVAPKTALMGDFKRAILFDRESTNISVGTANDDFLRNIVRVLAEMRAGFGVVRPAAFVEITVRP
jgi:HK97 family phage major capsid protein